MLLFLATPSLLSTHACTYPLNTPSSRQVVDAPLEIHLKRKHWADKERTAADRCKDIFVKQMEQAQQRMAAQAGAGAAADGGLAVGAAAGAGAAGKGKGKAGGAAAAAAAAAAGKKRKAPVGRSGMGAEAEGWWATGIQDEDANVQEEQQTLGKQSMLLPLLARNQPTGPLSTSVVIGQG